MQIVVINPDPPQSKSGNRTTAIRWARMLKELGHRATLGLSYHGQPYDAMIALDAWRSAGAIARFREVYPERPLIVALTGTDLYQFLQSDREATFRSLDAADRLIVLNERATDVLPQQVRSRTRLIYQSARPLPRRLPPNTRSFDVCVVGLLRDRKDPLRTALAVRDLPASSLIRVIQCGKAEDDTWARKAREEMRANPRYRWFGPKPQWHIRRLYARSRAMVISSSIEGGANVVSEGLVAGLPIIASDIPGNEGVLGRDYPGYFAVGDTTALRDALNRVETDDDYLRSLERVCKERAPLFSRESELASLKDLLAEFD